MMNELPPFWNIMTPQDQYEYSINPNIRGILAKMYSDPNFVIPRGGLLEGETPLPDNWNVLADPEIGANDPESRWYQFPEDQGLLNYGTRSGDGLSSEGYNIPLDYPKNAPNTPEHKQAYNFLRFNNLGGGI